MNKPVELILHMRLVAGDKTASDECVVHWLPQLVRQLSLQFHEVAARDEHLITGAVLDALFDYTREPDKYDPGGLSLNSYLFRAAKGDLLNALKRERTHRRDATSIHPVEQSLFDGNTNIEERVSSNIDAHLVWERVLSEITDPMDRQILALMLHGERATASYAQTLGITHLSEQEQKSIVKRHKDRLSKRLERLGGSING